jgi:predicted nucleotidyltransferase
MKNSNNKKIQEIESSLTKNKNNGEQGGIEWKTRIANFLCEADNLARNYGLSTREYLYLRELLADYLDAVFSFYANNFGFESSITALRGSLEDFLYKDEGFFRDPKINIQDKRIPGFSECCRATLIRLEALKDLRKQINNIEGIIVGGSVSYGRFYNIRERKEDASDIDIILVASDKEELLPLVGAPFLDPENKRIFREKLKRFGGHTFNGNYKILSQRFYYRNYNFTVSVHCFDFQSLKMIIDHLCLDVLFKVNASFFVEDFRSDPFKKNFFNLYNFNQEKISLSIEPQRIGGSYRACFPIYMICNNEFYSSIYLNLIIPEKWILLDQRGIITDLLKKFRSSLIFKLNQERRSKTGKLIIKSHLRYPLFRKSTSF